MNNNEQKYYYAPTMLNPQENINYPSENKIKFDKDFYKTVKENLLSNLKQIQIEDAYVNSVLSVLEANLSSEMCIPVISLF